MALDKTLHALPSDLHADIYERYIRPQVFADAVTQESPKVVVFGGQPGAGKSRSVDDVVASFDGRGGCVQVIGDDLRGYHPRYQELLSQDDKTAAFFTDGDTGRWVEMCLRDAREMRVNVVVEGTMRSHEVVSRTLHDFRAAGYATEARVLAVNLMLSEQGILQRYEFQKADRGVGRMTTERAHLDAYYGLPVTVEVIERDKLADRVMVLKRGGGVLYENALDSGNWISPPQAKEYIERERSRPMSFTELREYAEAYDRLLSMQSKRTDTDVAGDRLKLTELTRNARALERAGAFMELTEGEGRGAYPELAGAYEAFREIMSKGDQRFPGRGVELEKRARAFIVQKLQAGIHIESRTLERQGAEPKRTPERAVVSEKAASPPDRDR